MIDYKKLTNRIAQELGLGLDLLEEPAPQPVMQGESFSQAMSAYTEMTSQGLDYVSVVYALKEQFGDEVATQVLEYAADNGMMTARKNSQQDLVIWFAVSDGKETKVISEDVYDQYWSDLFEAGFDVVAKFFASPEQGEPSLEEPGWEEVSDPAKEENWVLI